MSEISLSPEEEAIINDTIVFVRKELENSESGHDWFHTMRVWQNTRRIALEESADTFTAELAALLHDIADAKFHGGNEDIGPRKAKDFLESMNVHPATTEHVVNIIRYMSFRKQFDSVPFNSREMQIVQDADRLDAIGAIGIARAFSYGGYMKRPMYDPAIRPDLKLTADSYTKSKAPTINHFYEKLLLLKDRMNTKTARQMAEKRHRVMLDFLDEFYSEWTAGE